LSTTWRRRKRPWTTQGFPTPSRWSFTPDWQTCLARSGAWRGNWRRGRSTSFRAIRPSRRIPRRRAWCWRSPIWTGRFAFREAQPRTNCTSERETLLVQNACQRGFKPRGWVYLSHALVDDTKAHQLDLLLLYVCFNSKEGLGRSIG